MDIDLTFDPVPGVAEEVEPGIRRVLVDNPSPMTFRGTNTYLLGRGEVAVIDPGPADPAHLRAILAALAPGERVSHILVTHSHIDHSPLASPLAEATGAPVVAFGDSAAGRNPWLVALAGAGGLGGGEGVEPGFSPDILLADGEEIGAGDWRVRALHTPGHLGNHICLIAGDVVFTGDHVMGWATSIVSPPDGDLGAYMHSLDRLGAVPARRFLPGHGAPVDDPAERVDWLLRHRRGREAEILSRVDAAGADVAGLTRAIYTEVPEALMGAAARNVLSHLLDLAQRGIVEADPAPGATARYFRR